MQKYNLIDLTTLSGGKYKTYTIQSAENFCKSVATGHYENFPVASLLLPKAQRNHIFNIYAFARTADDIADTLLDLESSKRIEHLNSMLDNLTEYCNVLNQNKPLPDNLTNPILIALSNTINELHLPLEPFTKLIKAFQMDAEFTQAERWEDLLYYCEHSANPVGELVLRVFGLYNNQTAPLSDSICTALQLANFWQDFSEDLPNNRCFVPNTILNQYGLKDIHYSEWHKQTRFTRCLTDIYEKTENLFDIGKDLLILLKPKRLRLEISSTWHGGKLILQKTKELGSDIITHRPKIRKSEMISLVLKTILS